jgi:hypothetical protein
MAGVAELLERIRADGPMRTAPMGFVAEIMNSLAEATMDYMVRDPTNAKKYPKFQDRVVAETRVLQSSVPR